MNFENENVLLMKILGNAKRQKILRIVYGEKKDLCVNEIAELAQISQSLASHQLAYLSAHGVVEGHRIGQTMCYVPAKNKLSSKLEKVLKVLSIN
jgi:DNA-binding transcriptional ArsR family regulator